MGMFDSVNVNCPKCQKIVEFQSKAGNCFLSQFSSHSVPPEIARSLDGTTEICKCGESITLESVPIENVRMIIKQRR